MNPSRALSLAALLLAPIPALATSPTPAPGLELAWSEEAPLDVVVGTEVPVPKGVCLSVFWEIGRWSYTWKVWSPEPLDAGQTRTVAVEIPREVLVEGVHDAYPSLLRVGAGRMELGDRCSERVLEEVDLRWSDGLDAPPERKAYGTWKEPSKGPPVGQLLRPRPDLGAKAAPEAGPVKPTPPPEPMVETPVE